MSQPTMMDIALKIASAEQALGALTHGQLKDLLLDNFESITDSHHAERLLIALGR